VTGDIVAIAQLCCPTPPLWATAGLLGGLLGALLLAQIRREEQDSLRFCRPGPLPLLPPSTPRRVMSYDSSRRADVSRAEPPAATASGHFT
jgi:hypothetical protein